MPGWLTTVLVGVASFFGWREKVAEKDLRDMDREAGAQGQKNVDLEKAVAVKDAQLEIASKPDETREELLAKAKKRNRNA